MNSVEEKITKALEKVRFLKEEKNNLEKSNLALQEALQARDREIERLSTEKAAIKEQIEGLLTELDNYELK
jgi:FtsZ-binding cell division protein ZapB